MTTQFTVGTTYYTRSICDHNCIYRIEVVGRTAKTIKVRRGNDAGPRNLRVAIIGGVETVKPYGSHSMAPMIDATDTTI